MEYKIKAGSQGHFYIPKVIRETLGNELSLVPNAKAGVIYPKGSDLKEVILSLQIILQDLQLRAGITRQNSQVLEAPAE